MIAALLALALSPTAAAQGCPDDVVTGTVKYELMHGAIATNARVYGAAALLEDHLLPVLEIADWGAAHYTVTAAPGLLRVPICENEENLRDTELGAIDTSAGAFGAAGKLGPVSFFLAGSSATHALAPTAINERAITPFLGVGMVLAAPVAFYQREFGGDGLSFTFDAMVGANVDAKVLQISAAYVASRGGYVNVGARKVRAFFGSVVRPQEREEGVKSGPLDALPYTRFGFSDLDWLVGEATADRIGSTSVFLRRMKYEGFGGDPNGPAPAYVPFTTLHLQQYQLLDHLDFALSARVQPDVSLNEAMVGVSTGTALPESVVVSRLAREGLPDGDWGGLRFQAGVVNLPETAYYGSAGGYRFRWNIDWNAAGYEADGYRLFFMSIGMNHPDTLANFPYADNAGYLSISGSFL